MSFRQRFAMQNPPQPPAGDDDDRRRLRALFDGVTHFVGLLTPDGIALEANRAALELVDARRDEVLGRPFWETPWWPRDPARQEGLHGALRAAAAGTASRFVAEYVRGDGRTVKLDFSLTPVRGEDGRVAYIIPEGRDVTEQRAAERALRESEARLSAILSSAAEGIIGLDGDGIVTFANPAASRLLGYTPDELVGSELHSLIHHTHADGRPYPHSECPMWASVHGGGMVQRDDEVYWRADGTALPVEYTSTPLRIGGPAGGAVLVFRDATERKRAEEALRAMSLTDELTGLHNRRGFLSLAPQTLRQARRSGTYCVLIFIDLDDFKPINDIHGHLAGDRALAEVGGLLREVFRESDIVARYGGDEFVVLSVGGGATALEAQRARLRRRLEEHNARPGAPFPISLSMGTAIFDPGQPAPLEQLIRKADEELYREKRGESKGGREL
ncbi:MAG TPA: diguanylate cyclase [Gemmatimonadales bacterium]